MSDTTTRHTRRQILGKRMGLAPYYRIVEQTDTRLVLQSSPGANRKPGRAFMLAGGALVLLSVSIFILSFISGGAEDFGALFMGMICSWPCGVVGGVVLIGGSAIAKTINTITIDTESRTIVYSQKARKERRQTLSFDQVSSLQMARQPFNASFFLRRIHQVATLELLVEGDYRWLIDSASTEEALIPTAHAVSTILGHELVLNTTSDDDDDSDDSDKPHPATDQTTDTA